MLEECQAKEIAVLGFEDLFCGCERYVIPMYQRGFAWEYDGNFRKFDVGKRVQ